VGDKGVKPHMEGLGGGGEPPGAPSSTALTFFIFSSLLLQYRQYTLYQYKVTIVMTNKVYTIYTFRYNSNGKKERNLKFLHL